MKRYSKSDLVGDVPFYAKGCPWRFWGGYIGINSRLSVADGDMPVGFSGDLTERARKALANRMIELWTKFRDEEPTLRSGPP